MAVKGTNAVARRRTIQKKALAVMGSLRSEAVNAICAVVQRHMILTGIIAVMVTLCQAALLICAVVRSLTIQHRGAVATVA